LLLPCLFMVTHVKHVRTYIMEDLTREIIRIERSVGVTRAGRSHRRHYRMPMRPQQEAVQSLFLDNQLQREHAKELTQAINNLSTWIIFTKRSPQWDIDCVKFLLQLLESNTRLAEYRGIPAQTFRETLHYVQSFSEACLEVTQTSEARMQLQLNIVSSSSP
jgi:hypothetical protein